VSRRSSGGWRREGRRYGGERVGYEVGRRSGWTPVLDQSRDGRLVPSEPPPACCTALGGIGTCAGRRRGSGGGERDGASWERGARKGWDWYRFIAASMVAFNVPLVSLTVLNRSLSCAFSAVSFLMFFMWLTFCSFTPCIICP